MKARHVVTLIIYIAVNFAIATIWHLVLFKEILDAATPFAREQPIFPLGIAAMVVQGSLLIGIYPKFHQAGTRVFRGLVFGLGAGIFLAAGSIWVDVAKFAFEASATYLSLETLYTLISFALLGLVVAMRHEQVVQPAPVTRP